jgi:hypothetical protein
MERPDIETLLKQNPKVDRETLRRYLEEQTKTIPDPRKRGTTSPYNGRRLTPIGKTGWTAVRRTRRSHYPTI